MYTDKPARFAHLVLAMWTPLVATLLAYLLRTFSLDLQSFWIDEVYASYFVSHSFPETVKLVISPANNGPLYFLILWGWRQLAGSTDFALRYLSDLCSTLTIPVLWQLGKTWFGRRAAGLTALLLAISPFAIWFGQETKMYALYMLLAALSTLLFAYAVTRNRCSSWFTYGLAINALGYSHFFGAFTIAAQGVLLVTTHLQKPKIKVIRNYIIMMAAVGTLYAPVARYVWHVVPHFHMQDISKGFVEWPHMLQELTSEYLLRVSRIYVPHLWPLMGLSATALIVGLVRAWDDGWRRALYVVGLTVVPVAIFYPISYFVPVFSPKYLSPVFLMFTLALGLAIDQLRRWWQPLGWLALTGLFILDGWVNIRILTNPCYQRTDFRAAVAYIEEHAEPNDLIITYAHYVDRAIKRYEHRPIPVIRFQGDPYDPKPFYRDLLEKQNKTHNLWLVLHQDQAMAPQNQLREAAVALYPQTTGVYPNNGQIAVLGFNIRWRHTQLPSDAKPAEITFVNGLSLVGYKVDATALSPTDNLFHPPSNWLHVTTYWQQQYSNAPQHTDFTPFIHLVDNQGNIWGGELQRPPTVFHRNPPATWGSNTIVEAHYDVNLNPVTPSGAYQLIIGLKDKSGTPIAIMGGDTTAHLTTIRILP